jgi:hypothetical protein
MIQREYFKSKLNGSGDESLIGTGRVEAGENVKEH